jgi:cellulose synthase/poly-beta-1,6-N-acetylglucosamine synthase-like glycosyltransferase
MFGLTNLFIALMLVPILVVMIDGLGQAKARLRPRGLYEVTPSTAPCDDFTLVVTIWGNIAYLENVDYLRQYGDRVLLTTSAAETPEFYESFYAIAAANGFRTHVAPRPAHSTDGTTKRQIGGTLRDTIVRDAHRSITSTYVVCIDADTVTDVPVDYLVGAFRDADLDIASVRLEAANRNTLLARLQGHEYRMAMQLRRVMPWMVSGACHVAKRDVHRDIMRRHSLFFQGNDVELGLIAKARSYRVGHIPFVVPTEVPSTFKAWWRQRTAWAGGEFRVMIVNIRMCWRHPFMFLYGAIIVIALLPTRYYYLTRPTLALLSVLACFYLLLIVVNWRHRDRALLVYPFYSLFTTLVVVPFGIFTYGRMALKHRNLGIIEPERSSPVGERGKRRREVGRHRLGSPIGVTAAAPAAPAAPTPPVTVGV